MPLRPPRALKSSTEVYGHRSTFTPFTFISEVMLPAEGMSEMTVWFLVSSSCTMSPFCRAAYCAAAGREAARQNRMENPKDRVNIGVLLKAAWFNPEAFLPAGARLNVLQLFVFARVRKIQGVADAGHRLDADEVGIVPRRRGRWRRVRRFDGAGGRD